MFLMRMAVRGYRFIWCLGFHRVLPHEMEFQKFIVYLSLVVNIKIDGLVPAFQFKVTYKVKIKPK